MDYFIDLLEKAEKTRLFESYFVPLLSVLIASIAVYVSWNILSITRRHNELSLKPYLIFRVNADHPAGEVRIFMLNKGLGPCIFRELNIIYKGEIYTSTEDPFRIISQEFDYTDDDFDLRTRSFNYPLKNYALTRDDDKNLLKYSLLNKTKKESEQFYEEFKKIKFQYAFIDYYKNRYSDDFIPLRDIHNEEVRNQ